MQPVELPDLLDDRGEGRQPLRQQQAAPRQLSNGQAAAMPCGVALCIKAHMLQAAGRKDHIHQSSVLVLSTARLAAQAGVQSSTCGTKELHDR